jgi:hypothetical protein
MARNLTGKNGDSRGFATSSQFRLFPPVQIPQLIQIGAEFVIENWFLWRQVR